MKTAVNISMSSSWCPSCFHHLVNAYHRLLRLCDIRSSTQAWVRLKPDDDAPFGNVRRSFRGRLCGDFTTSIKSSSSTNELNGVILRSSRPSSWRVWQYRHLTGPILNAGALQSSFIKLLRDEWHQMLLTSRHLLHPLCLGISLVVPRMNTCCSSRTHWLTFLHPKPCLAFRSRN